MKKHLIGLFCILACSGIVSPAAASSIEVYSEGLGTGWSIGSYGATVTHGSTAYPFKGNGITAKFTWQWGEFDFNGGLFDTNGLSHLTLAVRHNGGALPLFLFAVYPGGGWSQAVNLADYTNSLQLPSFMYKWIRVPLSALGIESVKYRGTPLSGTMRCATLPA